MERGRSVTVRAAAFVGREAELGILGTAFDQVLGGRGRLVLMHGEPGIGKSRLADEFAERARAAGARVLWGRCWEAGGAPPYWPWIECLRAYVAERDVALLRDELGHHAPLLAQMLPDLLRLWPDLPQPPEEDPDTARFRLFDATAILLRRAAADEPLVLVLEDVHAADEPSLLLLRFVGSRLVDGRVMVVATYRDTELSPDHPLVPTLVDLARAATTTRITLTGLEQDDVRGFVVAVARENPQAALVSAIHRETEGNPLFVGELVRLLAAEGRLEPPTGERPWTAVVPQGVREVIDMRLGRLSEGCLEVLALASVVGREFGVEVLERLHGEDRAAVLAAIDEASRARVLVDVPQAPGRLRFSHALVRDSLYDSLGPGRRAVLHRRVAESLAAQYGFDPGPLLAELAHHFFAALPEGDAGTAADHCRRAAVQAASALAYEEAARLYRMALRALEAGSVPDEVMRCGLLLGLGDAEARSGDAEAASESFLQAAEIARRAGMARQLGIAALGYGGRFVWARAGGDRRLAPLLEEALDALGTEDETLRARLLARLAGALRDDPDPARRAKLSHEAVALASKLGDERTLAYVLDGRWAAIWGPDTTEDRLALAEELIRAAAAAGDAEREFQGHHYRMVSLLEKGAVREAREELAIKERIATELRQPAQQWYLVVVRALFAAFEGRLIEAERLSEEALLIGERAYSAWDARFNHRVRLFIIRRDQGRLAELETSIRESVPEYDMSYPFVRALLALLLAESGRSDEARYLMGGLIRDGQILLPRDNEWLFGMATLAEVVSTLGESERAALLYEELAPYSGTNIVAPIEAMVGSVDRFLGLLAASNERWADAERHFRDGEAMNRRMGAVPALARTLLDRGRTLSTRRDHAARQHAVETLRQALDISTRHELSAIARESDSLLRKLGHEPRARERVRRTFVFTDIVGSTALVEAIGDDAWEDLRHWHDETLRELFVEHRGQEVDHSGDGFFVSFPEADLAISCAVAIQRRLSEHRRTHGFAPQVRIGLHVGEATESDRRYGGRAVHVAARIGALARGGEILVSRAVLDATAGSVPIGPTREASLKGVAELVEVAPVDWRAVNT